MVLTLCLTVILVINVTNRHTINAKPSSEQSIFYWGGLVSPISAILGRLLAGTYCSVLGEVWRVVVVVVVVSHLIRPCLLGLNKDWLALTDTVARLYMEILIPCHCHLQTPRQHTYHQTGALLFVQIIQILGSDWLNPGVTDLRVANRFSPAGFFRFINFPFFISS